MAYPNRGLPEKYQRRRKQFVEVVAEHKLDGTTLPRMIILADGRQYSVEIHGEPFTMELAGEDGQVTAYPIQRTEAAPTKREEGELTYLFECSKRWYVLMKAL